MGESGSGNVGGGLVPREVGDQVDDMRFLPRRSFLAGVILSLAAFASPGSAAEAGVSVATGQPHRGWTDAVVMKNRAAEVVIVPSLGRVMQFRFVGDAEGPFWENEKLVGKPMPQNPWQANPGSFGGDKTWPAPQRLWNWPPPDVFDTASLTAKVNDDKSVTLESPVSARFGIKTVRKLVLDPQAPVLRIETTYEKVSGDPLNVSVWVITQLGEPAGIFVPVPKDSKFPTGAVSRPVWSPEHFKVEETHGWLRYTRNPKANHKTGTDGSTMVWAGEKTLLRIDMPRVADATYPDDGRSLQIYTNADPVPYVELETISPLKELKAGEKMSATNTYRLAKRSGKTLEEDVKALLAQ